MSPFAARFSPLLLLAALAPLAAADPSPMAQAKQEAAMYRSLLLKKEFGMLDKGISPKFSIVYPDGRKTGKAGFLADTKEFWGPLKVKSLMVDVISAKGSGTSQVFVWEFKADGTMKLKGPKPAVVKNDAIFELHKVKKGGAWIVDSGKCLKMVTTVDGKAMR